ncbi:hypothetical protein [Mesorhizobium sp. M0199]|uniref:hypothetical protein n=1 Tax=unclassified Mesorhizobium TaxID=325217 RepID=UPI003337D196
MRIARSYLKAARLEVAMSGTGDIGNPAMSQIVNAAIAYADALTARFAGKINRADHAAVVKTMRRAWKSPSCSAGQQVAEHPR